MKAHRYNAGDQVLHDTREILYPGVFDAERHGYKPLPVVIIAQLPHDDNRISDSPRYAVRALTPSPAHRWYEVPENQLRDRSGEVYTAESHEFMRRCRMIESVEIIEGHVQPLGPWTEARVRADMARERAMTRREAARNHRRLFSFFESRFGILH